MSGNTAVDSHAKPSVTKHGSNINAGIDSGFASDPVRRGSLSPSELDSIHQTNSFKQAAQLQEEDNLELEAKLKQMQRAKAQKK